MIAEASKDILTIGFGSVMFKDDTSKKWSNSQLWKVIRSLSEASDQRMIPSEMLYNIFKGNKTAMKALVNANILRLENDDSNSIKPVQYVRAYSPLFAAAFRKLSSDLKLSKNMDRMSLESALDEIREDSAKVENELLLLERSAHRGDGVSLRKAFLDNRLLELSEKAMGIQQHIQKL